MVTKLDAIKLLALKVRKFNPELRFAHRVYPNRCFGKDLLFGAVRVEDSDCNLYPSSHMGGCLVLKGATPVHLPLDYSWSSLARCKVWDV